jgi:hypothetical protein
VIKEPIEAIAVRCKLGDDGQCAVEDADCTICMGERCAACEVNGLDVFDCEHDSGVKHGCGF